MIPQRHNLNSYFIFVHVMPRFRLPSPRSNHRTKKEEEGKVSFLYLKPLTSIHGAKLFKKQVLVYIIYSVFFGQNFCHRRVSFVFSDSDRNFIFSPIRQNPKNDTMISDLSHKDKVHLEGSDGK